jgi:hypothetical protein
MVGWLVIGGEGVLYLDLSSVGVDLWGTRVAVCLEVCRWGGERWV